LNQNQWVFSGDLYAGTFHRTDGGFRD